MGFVGKNVKRDFLLSRLHIPTLGNLVDKQGGRKCFLILSSPPNLPFPSREE